MAPTAPPHNATRDAHEAARAERRAAIEAQVLEARAIPILDVLDKLPHAPLKRAGREWVGPCPACGGDDRFSVNPAREVYNCRQCGGGDALGLVQKVLAVDFLSAVAFVTGRAIEAPGISAEELERRKAESRRKRAEAEAAARETRERRRRDAFALWKAATPLASVQGGNPVADYLALRGVPGAAIDAVVAGRALRLARRLPYHGAGGAVLFEGPAMLAALQRPDGTFGGVHRTWIDLTQPKGRPVMADPAPDSKGAPLPMKLTLGDLSRAAIRLVGEDPAALPPVMLVGEGIETTLSALAAARERWGDVAAWCAVSRGHMAGRMLRTRKAAPDALADQPDMDDPLCWLCPPMVQRLVYLGDDGADHRPTRDALTRGLRRHIRRARTVEKRTLAAEIAWAGAGMDFNDLVNLPPTGRASGAEGGGDESPPTGRASGAEGGEDESPPTGRASGAEGGEDESPPTGGRA